MNSGKLTSRGTVSSPRFLPKPNLSIYDLDADIAAKIKRALDTAPQDRNWRAFVVTMADKFKYKQFEVEAFGLAASHPSGSPAGKLWNDLASKGFKVKHLIHYLDKLQWEPLLYDLKPYEAIKVLSDPPEKVKVYVGETLILQVTATGFPYPRYQWFRANDEVQGASEDQLNLQNVTSADEGSYCCRIHNSADLDKIVFTKKTAVLVRGNPQQSGWPEHPVISPAENENVRSPQIVFETRESTICVNVGEPFILQCKAVGTGALEYRWLKNGQLQPCISQDYMLQRCSIVDSGSYECLVKNQYGETKSKLFRVRVVVDSTTASAASPRQSMMSQPSKGAFDNDSSSLDIIAQPKSCTIERGGSALFSCQVLGEPPIMYQWYKDGRLIPDETHDNLAIRMVTSYEQEACFQCRVWNRNSEVISAGAFLRLDVESPNSPHNTVSKYTATDKIALLIGNYDYMSADSLKAPKTDVLVLAELFKAMDFKVVSLLNLTLEEMQAAVKEFCHLLQGERPEGSGMYGVFYFCGHGIEDNGQCYLVPQDAPTGYSASNCLCANKVQQQMQQMNPAVCTMIIDCCRIVPANPPKEILKPYLPLHCGNTIWLYATTQGMRAWEYDYEEDDFDFREPNGVLVKHLQRHLCRRKPIEAIFANLREDISAHPKLRRCQIPEIKSNLSEPERSLSDKIVYAGYTEVFSKRQMKWKNAHIKPDNCSVYIKPLGVTVDVEYQADFSNVMTIYLTVSDPGATKGCHAWVVNLPPTLSVMKDPCQVSLNPMRTKTVIQDIQKLKDPLSFNIKLRYSLKDSVDMFQYEHGPIEVGFPLISTLELWKGDLDLRQNSQHREPTEQGEECHNMDPPYINLPPEVEQYENFPLHYQNVPR